MDEKDPLKAASAQRRRVTEEDFRVLYELLRGAQQANRIVTAQDAFREDDHARALELLEDASSQYQHRHRGVLKEDSARSALKDEPADKQTSIIRTRQQKIREIAATFNELLQALRRMVDLQQASAAGSEPARTLETPSEAVTAETEAEQASASRVPRPSCRFSAAFQQAYAAAQTPSQQVEVLRQHFDLRRAMAEEDLAQNTLYFVQSGSKTHLVRTSSREPITDVMPLREALTGRPIKPVPTRKFLELGKAKRAIRLLPKQDRASDETPAVAPQETAATAQPADLAAAGAEAKGLGLGMGDFSQLLDAAQRSGLVQNVDIIAHVRDREFRKGDYQKSLQDLESLFAKFTAASAQREQRLRREEIDIKSGKIPMSPKELQQKRARDAADAQRIERGRKKFQRVIEGLRMLTSGRVDDA